MKKQPSKLLTILVIIICLFGCSNKGYKYQVIIPQHIEDIVANLHPTYNSISILSGNGSDYIEWPDKDVYIKSRLKAKEKLYTILTYNKDDFGLCYVIYDKDTHIKSHKPIKILEPYKNKDFYNLGDTLECNSQEVYNSYVLLKYTAFNNENRPIDFRNGENLPIKVIFCKNINCQEK